MSGTVHSTGGAFAPVPSPVSSVGVWGSIEGQEMSASNLSSFALPRMRNTYPPMCVFAYLSLPTNLPPVVIRNMFATGAPPSGTAVCVCVYMVIVMIKMSWLCELEYFCTRSA